MPRADLTNDDRCDSTANKDYPIAISTKNVSKSFGNMWAVNNVSIDAREGELRAIIGPNGAGKTTLFNLICGNLSCNSGKVELFGKDITHLSLYRRARLGLGRTYQRNSIFFNLSVYENLMLADMSKEISRDTFTGSREKSGSMELLKQFGLEGKAEMLTQELSYGEQRKLEIILGLALKSKVLLLDEPAAGLSPNETSEIVRLIKTLKGKTTVILIEHDMDVVFGVADRITVLHHGVVLADGSRESIKNDAKVRDAYFGTSKKG
jgi:branched-chain amino acid transport system ATP-binding protein